MGHVPSTQPWFLLQLEEERFSVLWVAVVLGEVGVFQGS